MRGVAYPSRGLPLFFCPREKENNKYNKDNELIIVLIVFIVVVITRARMPSDHSEISVVETSCADAYIKVVFLVFLVFFF